MHNLILTPISVEELTEKIALKTIELIEQKKQPPTQNTDELLTRAQTCDFLQINSSTLWQWTKKGKVNCFGISNRRYYKKADLLNSLLILKK